MDEQMEEQMDGLVQNAAAFSPLKPYMAWDQALKDCFFPVTFTQSKEAWNVPDPVF